MCVFFYLSRYCYCVHISLTSTKCSKVGSCAGTPNSCHCWESQTAGQLIRMTKNGLTQSVVVVVLCEKWLGNDCHLAIGDLHDYGRNGTCHMEYMHVDGLD